MDVKIESSLMTSGKDKSPKQLSPVESGNSVNSDDVLPQRSIAEFNKTFENVAAIKTENGINTINRCLALLATSLNPADADPDKPEIAVMLINLYNLMNTMEGRSALLWSSVGVLEQMIQNSNTRIAAVEKFKFMQVLSRLLELVGSPDRAISILRLLENLSYGIRIKWHDGYLSGLIKTLINFTKSQNDSIKVSALSILINLCYKNLPAVYVLMRSISIEKFLTEIQTYGILACKMSYLLESDVEKAMSETDVHDFIGFTFCQILQSLKNFNSGQLRHSVDFFLDMRLNEKISNYFESFKLYKKYMAEIIEMINSCTRESESEFTTDMTFDFPICIGILMDFFSKIITSYGHRFKQVLPAIINCAVQWIHSKKAGTQALQFLATIFNTGNFKYPECIHEEIVKNTAQALIILQNLKASPEQLNALLKLMKALLEHGPVIKEFDYALKSYIFQKIFPDLHIFHASILKKESLTIAEIEVAMYVQTLSLVVKMAKLNPKNNWSEALGKLFKLPAVHFVLARAILGVDKEICFEALQLTEVGEFPRRYVSESISTQRAFMLTKGSQINEHFGLSNFTTSVVNVTTEQHLDELIMKLLKAHKENQIDNVLMSDVMELFELKMALNLNAEKDLLFRMDEYSAEVTSLSHKVAILSAELSRHQNQTFVLQMTMKSLKKQNIELEKEKKELTSKHSNCQKIVETEKQKQKELMLEIGSKNSSINTLKEQLSQAQLKIKSDEHEMENLRNVIFSKEERNEKLYQHIKDLNDNSKKLNEDLQERENRIIDYDREIQNLKGKNNSLEENLQRMMNLLTEKEDLVLNYEKDLQDMNEMRAQLFSIIQKRNQPNFP